MAGNPRALGAWRGMPNKKPVVAHLDGLTGAAVLSVEVEHPEGHVVKVLSGPIDEALYSPGEHCRVSKLGILKATAF